MATRALPSAPAKPARAGDAMTLLSSVIGDQMGLLTAQRDILTRVERLLTELVQARFDAGAERTAGSTVLSFSPGQDSEPASAED